MTILNRVKQDISFTDWMLIQFESYFSRCYSEEKKVKYEAHKAACGRLAKEMDVLDLINAARISKFIAQLSMKRNNRQMIKYFKPYHISAENPELPDAAPPLSIHQLMMNFSPSDNFIHRRILYEITGRKI